MDTIVDTEVVSYVSFSEAGLGGTVCGKSARTGLWGSGEVTNRSTRNDGKTWKYARLITPGFFAYSCMTRLPDGEIGLLYEADKYQTIRFRKFSVDWVKEGH